MSAMEWELRIALLEGPDATILYGDENLLKLTSALIPAKGRSHTRKSAFFLFFFFFSLSLWGLSPFPPLPKQGQGGVPIALIHEDLFLELQSATRAVLQ